MNDINRTTRGGRLGGKPARVVAFAPFANQRLERPNTLPRPNAISSVATRPLSRRRTGASTRRRSMSATTRATRSSSRASPPVARSISLSKRHRFAPTRSQKRSQTHCVGLFLVRSRRGIVVQVLQLVAHAYRLGPGGRGPAEAADLSMHARAGQLRSMHGTPPAACQRGSCHMSPPEAENRTP